MPIDLERARRETPGCDTVLHLNNAGAALMPRPVLEAVRHHLDLEAHTGGYEAQDIAQEAEANFYTAAAKLLGCNPDEIAFATNASRAWAMAFYAIPFAPGDRILTARAAYVSNYIGFLHVAQRTGATIDVIPSDASGQVDISALRRMMDERVKLIALTHVPTNGGLVNPAAEVGRVAREAGVLYLLDACQSAGQMPLDVGALGCDMLSATGRKFLRGPRGTGLLYVRHSVAERLDPPFLEMRSADWVAPDRYTVQPGARRFETWEVNVAAKIGLGAAMDYALGWGLDAIWARITALAGSLRARLEALPRVAVRDLGRIQCGIVTFTVEGMAPEAVKAALAEQNIHVNVSDASNALLDMQARGLEAGLVRASVHYYNSEAETDRFIHALDRLTATGG